MDKPTLVAAMDSPAVVAGCLVHLYASQTPDERNAHVTTSLNGIGFNALDASFGSSLAEQAIGKNQLTATQVKAARRLLKKYAGQIALLVDEPPIFEISVVAAAQRIVDSDLDEMPL